MSWKLRHEGSTRSVAVETVEEIHQGLADGMWSPEDEVQGPGEDAWVPLSAHPATEDAAAEVEPPEPAEHPDETNLDMNALIDVCLVLLIFFMLLVSYAAVLKRLEAGVAGANDKGNVQPLSPDEVKRSMIVLKITREKDRSVYRATVEEGEKELDPERLEEGLKALLKPGRSTLLLDHETRVPHGDVVKAQDAAAGLQLKLKLLIPGP